MTEKRPDISERVDEVCRCNHMKSKHNGLQGHGACQLCGCPFYTFAGWVYKAALELRGGDDVHLELIAALGEKGYDINVFIVGVEILETTECGVRAEVRYAYER